jgi:hypothetical protein
MKHPETNCTVKADFPAKHFPPISELISVLAIDLTLTHTTRSEHHNFKLAHIAVLICGFVDAFEQIFLFSPPVNWILSFVSLP